MLGSDRGPRNGTRLQPKEPVDRGSTTAERRPGPTKGTSWREVEHLEDQPPSEGSAQSSTALADSLDSELREIRIKDLDSGREFNVPQVCRRLQCTELALSYLKPLKSWQNHLL